MPGALLSIPDVAALFDVKPSTVTRWIREGRIPALRTPGGQYRIRRADIEHLLTHPNEGAAS